MPTRSDLALPTCSCLRPFLPHINSLSHKGLHTASGTHTLKRMEHALPPSPSHCYMGGSLCLQPLPVTSMPFACQLVPHNCTPGFGLCLMHRYTRPCICLSPARRNNLSHGKWERASGLMEVVILSPVTEHLHPSPAQPLPCLSPPPRAEPNLRPV